MINTWTSVFLWIVVILHLWFYVLESFLWDKPIGQKLLGLSKQDAQSTKVLAFNQGFYNCFMSAFLFKATFEQDLPWIKFFLFAIITLGLIGGLSAKQPKIIMVQTLPALLAAVALYLGL